MLSRGFPSHPHHAFTLIELAVVLVIVALLVGGVLVGATLIKTAELRNVYNRITQITNASVTFRTKFGNIPGDLQGVRATSFGFVARSGATGHGDGNYKLEACVAGGQALGCETALLWQDLSDAGLLKERFATTTDDYIDGTVVGFNVARHLPPSQLREGVSFFAYHFAGRNSLYIGAFPTINATGTITTADGLSVFEAEMMDSKIDNGVPSTGLVRAMTTLATPDVGGAASATECVVNTVPPTYNASDAFGSQVNCQLVFINTL